MTDLSTDVTVIIHGTEMDLTAVGERICPAEPDVGIMFSSIEEWSLLFADGTPIPGELYGVMARGEMVRVQYALEDALERGDFEPEPEEAK